MILVDTSVWVDHLRAGDDDLQALLERGAVLCHPWVTVELALGMLRDRAAVLRLLAQLPHAPVATPEELLTFIEAHELAGTGVGYVDVQLLASAALEPGTALWTRDRRLAAAAAGVGVAYRS